MKFFILFLSLYIFAISLCPCNDDETCHEHEQVILTQSTTEHTEHDYDLCTPFCNCQCTHSLAFYQSPQLLISEPLIIEQSVELYPNYTYIPYYGITLSIWQPPKFV